MKTTLLPIRPAISLLLVATFLQGCAWVDSTGKQTQEKQSDNGIPVPVVEFESITAPLVENQAIFLTESTTSRTLLEGSTSAIQNWRWELLDQSDSRLCDSFNGFDKNFIADSLSDACTSGSNCTVDIEELNGLESTEFTISMPSLKAPVALSYRLSKELDDGQTVERHQTLCAVSVNEKPTAENDTYIAVRGQQLIVAPNHANSLLANDFDDIDVRNQPLRVNTQVLEATRHADQFQLNADGSFLYRAAAGAELDVNGRQTDSFVYSVTDGLHEAQATVTIIIVAGNEEPQTLGSLPDVLIDLSDIQPRPAFEIDVSPYFYDPDADQLDYGVDTASLPAGLAIEITDQGLLSVNIDPLKPAVIEGIWSIKVTASDGLGAVDTDFLLYTFNSQANNQPPTVSDISNRTVEGAFTYDVSVFFNDPEGDELTFSSQNLPTGVQLSPSGVLSGIGSDDNDGRWLIKIQATDTAGNVVEDAFALRIKD